MGIPGIIELFIVIIIGIFVWLFFKKVKKRTKKPSSVNNNEKRKTKAKAKFCSECGTPIEGNDYFCPVCGAKVVDIDESNKKISIDDNRFKISPPPPPPSSSSKEYKKTSKSKLWLSITAILIISIGISIFT